jgi:hypothetical protein
MKEEIRELTISAKTFQATKCSACKDSLDLPVVHFLCMHSYHARCMQEAENIECPLCSPEYKKCMFVFVYQLFVYFSILLVLDIKENMNEEHQETFYKLLHKDGFSTIANYFGRGILNPPHDT